MYVCVCNIFLFLFIYHCDLALLKKKKYKNYKIGITFLSKFIIKVIPYYYYFEFSFYTLNYILTPKYTNTTF